jgi:hypothetical protein
MAAARSAFMNHKWVDPLHQNRQNQFFGLNRTGGRRKMLLRRAFRPRLYPGTPARFREAPA